MSAALRARAHMQRECPSVLTLLSKAVWCRVGEVQPPHHHVYTIKDNVQFSVKGEELVDGEWQPYRWDGTAPPVLQPASFWKGERFLVASCKCRRP